MTETQLATCEIEDLLAYAKHGPDANRLTAELADRYEDLEAELDAVKAELKTAVTCKF